MGWPGEPRWDIMHTLNKVQMIKGPAQCKGFKITGCPTISFGSASGNTLHSFILVELPVSKEVTRVAISIMDFCQQLIFRVIDTPKSHITTTNLNQNKWATKTWLGRYHNTVVKALGFGTWQKIRAPQLVSLEIFGRFCNTSVPQFLVCKTGLKWYHAVVMSTEQNVYITLAWCLTHKWVSGHVYFYSINEVLPEIFYIITKYGCINNLTSN